jgi:hypothetical protein
MNVHCKSPTYLYSVQQYTQADIEGVIYKVISEMVEEIEQASKRFFTPQSDSRMA